MIEEYHLSLSAAYPQFYSTLCQDNTRSIFIIRGDQFSVSLNNGFHNDHNNDNWGSVTAQISENLIYEGQHVRMCTNPLGDYFAFGGNRPEFADNCTALWRGYIGTWEIVGERLYLIELHGSLEDDKEATLATVFPDYPDRVFSHWYSGRIRIPQGKLLNYVHMGYGSTYERDLFLEIEKGVVKSTWVQQNGAAERKDAPEGYGISGMAVFPTRQKDVEKSS